MGRKKKQINKELIAEDWCFDCKDGGLLRVCDYKDCLKGFHPRCVEKDDSFLESEVPWTCRWHFCFICKNTPKFQCFCCPKAVCGRCLCDAEFAVVRRQRGFCSHCATLAGSIEGTKNLDSDAEKIDFNVQDTYEFNFKGYWDMVKEKEGLTSKHVHYANKLLRMGKNSDYLSDSYDECEGEGDASESDETQTLFDNDVWKDRKGCRGVQKRKRNKGNSYLMERKVTSKKKKKVFNGWGSELLFEFLASIGKDTTNELSQHEVTDIVIGYCNEHKLYDPEKKKKVMCDVRLKTLLRRKSVNKNRINYLLTKHFAANIEQSDNEFGHSSEDEGRKNSVACKKEKTSSSNRKSQNKEPSPDVKQGCFASVSAENIKLLYLKRSLVEELAKQPDTFDAKVIGSFVRTKSDPYDYLQKNPYQLLKVTGIKRTPRNGEVNADILLQLSNMPKDIPITKLSDDNVSEEECEDLRQRVKDGRLERPTVVEFTKKARSLHEDITKHWIVKELALLQNLVDQANEKGWRRELSVYMEKLMLLRTPSEQSRLLLEVPKIIADEPEVEPADKDLSRKEEQKNITSSESDLGRCSKPSRKSSEGNGVYSFLNDIADFAGKNQQPKQPEPEELMPDRVCRENGIDGMHHEESHESDVEGNKNHPKASQPELLSLPSLASSSQGQNQQPKQPETEELMPDRVCHENGIDGMPRAESHESDVEGDKNHPIASHPELLSLPLLASLQGQSKTALLEEQHFLGNIISREKQDRAVDGEHEKVKNEQSGTSIEIIELSDDEEKCKSAQAFWQTPDNLNSPVWYSVSPYGIKKGPFSMSVLKEWSDTCPHDMKYKVWKTGQNPKEAILLTDAIRQIFSGK